MTSFCQSPELTQRSRSEALRAASLFRQGSTKQALHSSKQVLTELSKGELGRWQRLLSLVIEDIETGMAEKDMKSGALATPLLQPIEMMIEHRSDGQERGGESNNPPGLLFHIGSPDPAIPRG